MSGGHFDYQQYRINDIAQEIEHAIEIEESLPGKSIYDRIVDDGEYRNGFSSKTLDEFKKGVKLLKEAQIYAQRIDWLLSGDDGEETFHKRLKEDLDKLK